MLQKFNIYHKAMKIDHRQLTTFIKQLLCARYHAEHFLAFLGYSSEQPSEVDTIFFKLIN